MRARYFWTVLMVLLVVAVSSTALRSYLRIQEQLEYIDQQVLLAAADLLDSDLNDPQKFNASRVEEVINEDLPNEEEIGKFFLVVDSKGKAVYRSATLRQLDITHLPGGQGMRTLSKGNKFLRYYTLPLPRVQGYTLQVGVATENLFFEEYFSSKTALLVLMILALGAITAWLLASNLLRPISRLASFLSDISRNPPSHLGLPELPAHLRYPHFRPSDEMAQLNAGLESLITRVNRGYRLTRVWSYQMAHELKTPLTILGSEIDRSAASGEISRETADRLRKEVMAASETVTSFLSWAELEGQPGEDGLYAQRARETAKALAERLAPQHPDRIELSLDADFHVFSQKTHLENVINNLLQNALQHTEGKVRLRVKDGEITVSDEGRGLPPTVRERLGEPFNRGPAARHRGHGLGLAYVHSIARIYRWETRVESGPGGTSFTLQFPSEAEEA